MKSAFFMIKESLLAFSQLWTFSMSFLSLVSISRGLNPSRESYVSWANKFALVDSKQLEDHWCTIEIE
jgi:hypothetical protein